MTKTITKVDVKQRLHSTAVSLTIAVLFVVVFGIGLVTISQGGHSLSVIDEHIHFDTAIRASHGEIPWRGAELGPELVNEWACGVGHEGGGLPYPCGDPRLGPDSIPSGNYSTGYAHYPTYFFAAAAFSAAVGAFSDSVDPLSAFRAFSASTLILGVVACGVFGWLLGLRGVRLVAALTLPVASSMIVFTGTILNPSSTAVLAGALIGGTGLLWIRRGRGFAWFAAAVAFSSSIAVTDTLPAGGFLIAMLVVLIARRRGWHAFTEWPVRWWHPVVIAAAIVAPVVVWGRVIAARATIPDSALYGFIPASGKRDIIIGAMQEITALHTPWRETGGIRSEPTSFVSRLVHAFSEGAPSWISTLVLGSLVVVLIFTLRQLTNVQPVAPFPAGAARDRASASIRLLALGTMATLVLYPPALRMSNWFTFGFDFPIVDRYSNALAPLLVLVLVMLIPNRVFLMPLAIIGTITAVGTVASGY